MNFHIQIVQTNVTVYFHNFQIAIMLCRQRHMSRYRVNLLACKLDPRETHPTFLTENWQKPSFLEEDAVSPELIECLTHSLKFLILEY